MNSISIFALLFAMIALTIVVRIYMYARRIRTHRIDCRLVGID